MKTLEQLAGAVVLVLALADVFLTIDEKTLDHGLDIIESTLRATRGRAA